MINGFAMYYINYLEYCETGREQICGWELDKGVLEVFHARKIHSELKQSRLLQIAVMLPMIFPHFVS